MSIRYKLALWIILVIVFFLAICNSAIFMFFKEVMEEKSISSQQSTIYNNQNALNYFFESINQAYLQLTGDEVFGKALSEKNLPFTLDESQARQSLTSQLSRSVGSLLSADENVYTNMLFLNDHIPITNTLRALELDEWSPKNVSGVYKNTNVKNTEWYKNAVAHPERFFVFINKTSNEFCLAHRLNNTYYTGDHRKEGLGVLLITLDYRKLEKIFKLSNNTANSFFLLLSPDDDILYKDKTGELPISQESIRSLLERDATTDDFADSNSQIIDLEGKDYIVNINNIKWDLSLLFLTPFSDITDQLAPIVNFTVIASFAVIILCAATILIVTKAITRPIVWLSKQMSTINDSRAVDFNALKNSGNDEVGVLYRSFEALLNRINHLILDVREQTTQKKEAELKALQAQINPHFVFNAMDAVNWIALSRNQDDIADIVNTITQIMRYSIKDPDSMVMLSDELENIKDYLSIQCLRYPQRIKYKTEIPTELEEMPIPKFVLQPLVENSIQHGFQDSQSSIAITIKAQLHENKLIIYIIDDGRGCDTQKLNDFLANKPSDLVVSNGFGLRNVNERLQLRFPQSSGLYYKTNEDEHFTAVINLIYGADTPLPLQDKERWKNGLHVID